MTDKNQQAELPPLSPEADQSGYFDQDFGLALREREAQLLQALRERDEALKYRSWDRIHELEAALAAANIELEKLREDKEK